MRSLLGAPIAGRGKVFGNIYVTDKQSAEMFDEEDERILVVLATQAAVAVENARLYDETERKGRELQRLQVVEERERIGKELHDGVIQSLFAVGMSLQALASTSSDANIAVAWKQQSKMSITRSVTCGTHIFESRPGILADRQLDQALKEMASEFSSRSGVVDGRRCRQPRRVGTRLVRRRRGAARAGGPLQRQPARSRHYVPDRSPAWESRASSSRSTTMGKASTWTSPPGGWVSTTFGTGSNRSGECSTWRHTGRGDDRPRDLPVLKVPQDHGPSAPPPRRPNPRILVRCSPGISSSSPSTPRRMSSERCP